MSYWRPVVNAILYSVQFEKELDDQVVDRVAHSLVTEPLATLTPDEEYQALFEGLLTRAPLPALVQMPQKPAELREFLSRVAARMNSMRPWPTLPFLRLPEESGPLFKNATPVARISASVDYVQARISRGFYWGTEYGIFLPLKLRSGRIIGMFTPYWDNSDDIVLVTAAQDPDPNAVIDELLSVTRIDPGRVARLTADGPGESVAENGTSDSVPPTSEEEVTAYLQRVLGTQKAFDVRESEGVWVCQERPDPELERRRGQEIAERASRGLPPEPGGGYWIYGIELDRSSWDETYFGTGQIHPKPWQVRIDLVSEIGHVLMYRIQAVSRADPPREPIDHHVTIDKVTKKVDYRAAPLSRFLIDAVRQITHPHYQGEPWLTTTTFDL
ncbi:hypothetical protein [Nocardia sp. NPDC060259]|uniref:hypothetical protein n=1 Tax=Nocardia sp. NPDC060259 TaxID=3347088 RepID=UPI00365D6B1D